MMFVRLTGSLVALATASCIADFAPVEQLPSGTSSDAGVVTVTDAGGRTGRPRSAAAPNVDTRVPSATDDGLVTAPERDPNLGLCDLSGSWLVTERMVLNALGARQVINLWRLLELEQDGEQVVVAKSLLCGDAVKGLPPIIITMDSSKLWDVLRMHSDMSGRKGTSRPSGKGCNISFERAIEVRGATASTFEDLEVPLPTLNQKASGDTPGWEDWDADGNPGLSVRVSGSLSGTLYITSRTWTEISGTADPSAGTFTLPMRWNQQRTPLGVSGSPLLAAPGGAPDADTTQHFAEFASLSADELGSSDDARCARARELAPMRTAKAMK